MSDAPPYIFKSGSVMSSLTTPSCAAEFEAKTPYYYSTYEDEDEVAVSDNKKVIIIGAGPIRIGQGIEFDYCCVHERYQRIRITRC